MNIRKAITVGDIPSPGALLGTTGSRRLIETINDSLGTAAFFGSMNDRYAAVTNAFIEKVVKPIQEIGQTISHVSRTLINPDEYRHLETLDDFRYTPPCMQMPILTYAPVRKLLEQGRISGYGFDPDDLPTEDVFGRLCSNGTIEDMSAAYSEAGNGIPDFMYDFYDDDPELSFDELRYIEETRKTIDHILEATLWDPTDPTQERG